MNEVKKIKNKNIRIKNCSIIISINFLTKITCFMSPFIIGGGGGATGRLPFGRGGGGGGGGPWLGGGGGGVGGGKSTWIFSGVGGGGGKSWLALEEFLAASPDIPAISCGPGGGGGGGKFSRPWEGPRTLVGVSPRKLLGGVGVLDSLGGAGGGWEGLFDRALCIPLRVGVPEPTDKIKISY